MQTFLFASLALFVLWLILFFTSHKTRKEQIIMSIVGLFSTPAILLVASQNFEFISGDIPANIGIEHFLSSFSLFGIAAIIYHTLTGLHLGKMKTKNVHLLLKRVHWTGRLFIILGIWCALSLLLTNLLFITTIQSLVVGGLFIGIYMIADRHDLFYDAVVSAIVVAALVFVIEEWFSIRLFPTVSEGFNQMKLLASVMTVDDLLWALTIGFTIGPMYEWLRRFEWK